MNRYGFDLDREMLKAISEEFNPINVIKTLRGPSDFEKYGRNLARRSLEEGEVRADRTYEVMKKAIEKTGELNFPLVPQRYIEIAYLSVQPFNRLWVLINSPKVFLYRLDQCGIYQAVRTEDGEEMARAMTCQSACFGMVDEIFSHFGFTIRSSMTASMAVDGNCQFRIEKR